MVFEKAGYPGWSAFIPLYNVYILVEMDSRKSTKWSLLPRRRKSERVSTLEQHKKVYLFYSFVT